MNVIHHERGRDSLYKIWHFIEGNMILYTYTDGGSIVFQDGVYPIQRGILCFIGSGKLHYTMPSDPTTYDRSKIFLSEDKKLTLLSLFSDDSPFFRLFSKNAVVYAELPSEKQAEVEELFGLAVAACSEKKEEVFFSCFFRLMIFLKDYAALSIPTPNGSLSRAIDFINKKYNEPISLEEICAHIHTSKYYFCRKFKEAMGMTVMEYLLKTRLAAARTLPSSTDLGIGHIAEECGFSSTSYFCQAFKEHLSISAGEYRTKCIETEQARKEPKL